MVLVVCPVLWTENFSSFRYRFDDEVRATGELGTVSLVVFFGRPLSFRRLFHS